MAELDRESTTSPSTPGRERDLKTFRGMALGFLLICVLSGVLHMIMTHRKTMRLQRYQPVYELVQDGAEAASEGPGKVLVGEVAATSFDKFFLNLDGSIQQIMIGDQRMPQIGDVLEVTVSTGHPPEALDITLISSQGQEDFSAQPR